MVYNSQLQNKDEIVFWLFVTLRESILSIDYYSQVIEPDVLSKTFNYIFEKIDPEMYALLGETPSLVFLKHFCNLFTDFNSPDVSKAILDVLFCYGSGFMTATL